MALLGKFFGRTASEGAAFALGTAVGPALTPAVREIVNEAWSRYPLLPLPFYQAARAEAMQVATDLDKAAEAGKGGLDGERFHALVDVFRTYPEIGELLDLRRRGAISEGDLGTLLNRLGFTDENASRLSVLQHVLLSAADLAMMRQQGFVSRERQVADSARVGVSEEHADLLFEISGLPPGIETALEMLRRSIITEAEFAQIVREGHTKTKYTDELLALRHPVLSATQAATLRLKGWISAATSYQLGALTGYTQEQMDRLYQSMGRPIAPVQAYTAWARGAPGPYGGTFDEADFHTAIRQSDIRPEYGDTLWHNRFNYPSLFQLRRAVQDGGISRDRALTILHYERYEQADAVALVDSWTTGTGTTAKGLTLTDLADEYESRFITRASYVAGLRELGFTDADANAKANALEDKLQRQNRNRLITRVHDQYVNHRISRDAALAALTRADVPARVRTPTMVDWDLERDLTPDAMSVVQIKKAWKRLTFTRPEAIDRLMRKGYDEDDANEYLDQ